MPVAEPFVSTRNPCKACSPLGACLAFRGIEGAVPFLHGSQGCATYIRRYLISHFREPMDVAASSFSESSTVFGGGDKLRRGLDNVSRQYQPRMIGIATTCLVETIGEDVKMLLNDYHPAAEPAPDLVHVSTPSYRGTHVDGFHAAVRAVVGQLAEAGEPTSSVNLFPGAVSPADLRHLKEIASAFSLDVAILPDYSDTLDGAQLEEYRKIPEGGTPLASIRAMGRAAVSIEFGRTLEGSATGAAELERKFGIARKTLGWPVGVVESDRFFSELSAISGRPVPQIFVRERGRLVDSYVDAHKYVFGKRAIVYGEEDLVVGLAAFLCEIGIQPVLCASGGQSGRLEAAVAAVTASSVGPVLARGNLDFAAVRELALEMKPDFMIGGSKGYSIARELDIPLIRVGFPIHDRIGGQRILHLGYRGAQQLFDAVTNTLLARAQDRSPVGYSYL